MPYVNNSYTSSYTAGLVGPASNNYTTLGGYNSCMGAIRAPVPMTSVTGYYIVPSYSSPGYDLSLINIYIFNLPISDIVITTSRVCSRIKQPILV